MHSRRLADPLTHELVKRHAARALDDQRQYDVAAVAVREALARCELRRVAIEHGEVVLGRRQLVHRNRHQVVAELEVARIFVQVVTDARAV